MCITEFLSAFTINPVDRRLEPKQTGRSSITVAPPDIGDLKDNVRLVLKAAELRDDRLGEILTQYAQPTSYYAMLLNLNPNRHQNVFDLMSVAQYCGKSVVMEFKHIFNFPRPADICPDVDPMIQTPGHASYPAGHATETFMLSSVLTKLIQGSSRGACRVPHAIEKQLCGLAYRISNNRIIAGLHYPMDIEAGAALGRGLAELMIDLATEEGHLKWIFEQASKELST